MTCLTRYFIGESRYWHAVGYHIQPITAHGVSHLAIASGGRVPALPSHSSHSNSRWWVDSCAGTSTYREHYITWGDMTSLTRIHSAVQFCLTFIGVTSIRPG